MGNNVGFGSAYNLGAVGTTVTSGAVSASVAIPNAADGNRAKQVRLVGTGNLYVKFTKGVGTATTSDVMVATNFDMVVNCRQFDTISYLQETVAAKLNITPLEV